jgi:acyl-CoA thioester hydrolase
MPGERRLRAHRRFQLRRRGDGETLMRAEVEYVCLELSSGRPTRSPPEFRDRYVPLQEVVAALPALAPL